MENYTDKKGVSIASVVPDFVPTPVVTPVTMMAGRTIFDAAGRTKEQYYPKAEDTCSETVFNDQTLKANLESRFVRVGALT